LVCIRPKRTSARTESKQFQDKDRPAEGKRQYTTGINMRVIKLKTCVLLILAAQFIFPLMARAATKPQTPQEVATLYLQARQRADWKGAMEYVASDQIERLHPYALKVFEDEGKKNIFRKFFLGAEVTSDSVRTLPHRTVVGSYLGLVNLLQSSRSGSTELLDFQQLNSFNETPDLINIVVRENASVMGAQHQITSVLRLRRLEQRWYVAIDERIFEAELTSEQARRMLASGPYRTLSIDLRPMTRDQRIVSFMTVVQALLSDRWIKYQLVVGRDTNLTSELRQFATVLNVHYRIEFDENPTVKPDTP
jgi:hypothetical protein